MSKMKSMFRQAYALFGSMMSNSAKNSASLLLVCLILSFMLVPTLAQEPGDPAVGASLWPTLPCIGCHGDQAQGGFGPRLAGTGLSYEAVLLQVRSGGGGMPAFDSGQASDEEVRHMHAWLQSLGEQASVPSIEVPYPIDNLLQFFGTVSEVKVRSDFAKDLPERLAPGDSAKQLEILKQYVREGVDFANAALGEGEAALNEIPDAAVQLTLTQAIDFVRQIVAEGNAALNSGAYEDAWPHAAEMVRLSRLDAWPLATQSVRETGWVGEVVVKVTDQGGSPIPGALVTVLTAHSPVAAVTDATGTAVLDNVAAVPALQVKAYADGLVYHEVHANIPAGGSIEATIVLPGPSAGGQTPAVSGAAVSPESGAGDGEVTFSVAATDPQGKINLAEDQVFALNADLGVAYVLRHAGGDQWQTTVTLPGLDSGTYTFYVFAVDHQCNTSNIIPVTYTVP
jgi:hypothetical protein